MNDLSSHRIRPDQPGPANDAQAAASHPYAGAYRQGYDLPGGGPEERDFSQPAPSEWDRMMNSSPANMSPSTIRTAVKELLETAVYILLVFMIVRSVVQNFKIEGSSMEPSLESGQYILVNKLVYFNFDLNAPLRWLPGQEELPERYVYPLQMPQRGDVVVFEYPLDPNKDFIKRVIGLPGETVEIREGRVYVNGQQLEEPYLDGRSTTCAPSDECSHGPVVVPPNRVFVMGDNRANSSDSRQWDTLPLDRVIGQAWVLYYPVDDWGIIPHPSYAADE
jgi:signal peptidase I